MAEFEADCTELIAHGWGSTDRADIPADWRTRRGPDNGWREKRGRPYSPKPRKLTWRERRAIFEAVHGLVPTVPDPANVGLQTS